MGFQEIDSGGSSTRVAQREADTIGVMSDEPPADDSPNTFEDRIEEDFCVFYYGTLNDPDFLSSEHARTRFPASPELFEVGLESLVSLIRVKREKSGMPEWDPLNDRLVALERLCEASTGLIRTHEILQTRAPMLADLAWVKKQSEYFHQQRDLFRFLVATGGPAPYQPKSYPEVSFDLPPGRPAPLPVLTTAESHELLQRFCADKELGDPYDLTVERRYVWQVPRTSEDIARGERDLALKQVDDFLREAGDAQALAGPHFEMPIAVHVAVLNVGRERCLDVSTPDTRQRRIDAITAAIDLHTPMAATDPAETGSLQIRGFIALARKRSQLLHHELEELIPGQAWQAPPEAHERLRTCPWCAERIWAFALVCRFCGRAVEAIPASTVAWGIDADDTAQFQTQYGDTFRAVLQEVEARDPSPAVRIDAPLLGWLCQMVIDGRASEVDLDGLLRDRAATTEAEELRNVVSPAADETGGVSDPFPGAGTDQVRPQANQNSVVAVSCASCQTSQEVDSKAASYRCTGCDVVWLFIRCPGCKRVLHVDERFDTWKCPNCNYTEASSWQPEASVTCSSCKKVNKIGKGIATWSCGSCKRVHKRCTCGLYVGDTALKSRCPHCRRTIR